MDDNYNEEFKALIKELVDMHEVAIEHLKKEEYDLYLYKMDAHHKTMSLLEYHFKKQDN